MLGFVLENRIACCDAQTGEVTFLTSDHGNPPSADAVVFSRTGALLRGWKRQPVSVSFG
jgi:hypothetical protein